MQDAITFINQVGFPIFVAVVLLFRVQAMHAENLKAIHALTQAITTMNHLLTGQRVAVHKESP